MQYGVSKNAEFDAHFESVEKVAKRLLRKMSYASNFAIYDAHMEFLTKNLVFAYISTFL
jgi:hypothetical protein